MFKISSIENLKVFWAVLYSRRASALDTHRSVKILEFSSLIFNIVGMITNGCCTQSMHPPNHSAPRSPEHPNFHAKFLELVNYAHHYKLYSANAWHTCSGRLRRHKIIHLLFDKCNYVLSSCTCAYMFSRAQLHAYASIQCMHVCTHEFGIDYPMWVSFPGTLWIYVATHATHTCPCSEWLRDILA